MDLNANPYILYITTFMASLAIGIYAVRKTLFIATRRQIYDVPDKIRKIHGAGIPSLGGIGIFTGYIVAAAFFMYQKNWNFIIASSVILFFTGIYDDLVNMRPSKKLLAQLLAAGITVYFADVRISSFYGAFGIGELPYWLSVALTVLGCTLFINVFNFVDGIDGLAGITAALYLSILTVFFAVMNDMALACIAISLTGATFGLLYFNVPPAKIYMGDTGSMVLGFTIFSLTVLFLRVYNEGGAALLPAVHSGAGAFSIALSLVFYPIYDGLRVFAIRLAKGVSPFRADRNHLHYFLLDAGLSHLKAVAAVVTVNIIIIAAVYFLQDLSPLFTLGLCVAIESLFVWGVYRMRQQKLKT